MPTMRRPSVRTAALGLAAIAFGWFLYWGPYLALTGPQEDLSGPYGMARAWRLGENPYNPDTILRVSTEASGGVVWWVSQPVYPPTTIAMLAPFAALPWAPAALAWHLTLLAAYLLAAIAVARWIGISRRVVPAACFATVAFLFAPAHTGLMVGNPGVVSGGLALIATAIALPAGRARAAAGGLMLGVAAALKPQLAIPFWLYLVATRRWTAAAIGAGVPVAVLAGMAWDLSHINPSWLSDLSAHIAAIQVPLFRGDPLLRFGRVHLAVLVEFFVSTSRWIPLIVVALLALPALIWARQVWRRAPHWRATHNHAAEAVAITPVLSLGLLAMYHRPYDIVTLLPAAGWVVWEWSARGRAASNASRLAAATLAAFLVMPWVTVWLQLAKRGTIPPALANDGLFQFVVMAHPTWALLGLTGAGLWALMQPEFHLDDHDHGHGLPLVTRRTE